MNRLKAVIAGVALAVGFSASAQAEDFGFHGDLGVASNNVYRGELLSQDITGFGSLRADNILFDGVFFEGSASTVNTQPLTNLSARTEINGGWHGTAGDLGMEFSVARVFNTTVGYESIHNVNAYNLFDYNELRTKLSYQFTPEFKVYGELAQGFGNPDFKGHPLTLDFNDYRYLTAGNNLYGAVGAEVLVGDNLTIGGLVSGTHYDSMQYYLDGPTQFNNTAVYGSLALVHGLDAFASYSFGGQNVVGQSIGNYGTIGVRYHF